MTGSSRTAYAAIGRGERCSEHSGKSGDDAPAAAAAAPPGVPVVAALPAVGWRGSKYKLPLVDGVHEHREAIAKRRRLRLLPEIQRLVSQL